MKAVIKKLESINHKEGSYKDKAYEILNTLNRNELIEIILLENLRWVNIYSTDEHLKEEIYESIVKWKCEQNILGDIAAANYWSWK